LAYTVEIRPAALEFLQQMNAKHRQQVVSKIEALKTDPRPANAEPLQGYPQFLRLRSGSYRIVYAVNDQVLVVTVILVGNRGNIYERLRRMLER
jgi:mRNA interferase RelE/StbE